MGAATSLRLLLESCCLAISLGLGGLDFSGKQENADICSLTQHTDSKKVLLCLIAIGLLAFELRQTHSP